MHCETHEVLRKDIEIQYFTGLSVLQSFEFKQITYLVLEVSHPNIRELQGLKRGRNIFDMKKCIRHSCDFNFPHILPFGE